ncbi:alpha/beta hydrolase [Streptomyces mesophilus]|uniref:alpha/beta hydrolase n=1 Tax=Streptomyces mesophilus TaxID=1775132 RepID=UPI00332EBE05
MGESPRYWSVRMRKVVQTVTLVAGALVVAAMGTALIAPADAGRQASTTGAAQLLTRTDAARQSTLRWAECPGPGKGTLECSSLEVPLDYGAPDGRQIKIALSRPVGSGKDRAKRRGVLLMNPGGPGLAGLNSPLPAATPLPLEVRETYEVIGFDPRGVGRSAPVTCGFAPQQVSQASNPRTPYNDADVAKQADTAEQLAELCAASKTADLLPFMTTANTARDMDRIREALGEPAISYFGVSYGTYLGAVYATLFPHRSDRFVLDSSLPPEGYDIEALRGQGEGFEERFPDFGAFAAADPRRYRIGGTPAAVREKYFQLARRLDTKPEQGYDGATFRGITAALLRNDATFAPLAEIWHKLDTGQRLKDPGQAADGGSGSNFAGSYLAVICADNRWPQDVKTYQDNVDEDRVRYPMYGPYAANIRPCAYWQAKPAEDRVKISSDGPAARVLLLQNLRDPATPLAGAKRMREALGDRARMVTVDQGGHGAYLFGANKCGNDAVTDYLTTGRMPEQDTHCPASPSTR